MKKKRLSFILLIILLVLCLSSSIALSSLSDLVDNAIPQSVYSVFDGLEPEKVAQMIETGLILAETYNEDVKQNQSLDSMQKLLTVMFSDNREAIDDMFYYLTMPPEKWFDFFKSKVEYEFFGNLTDPDPVPKPTPPQAKRVNSLLIGSGGGSSKDGEESTAPKGYEKPEYRVQKNSVILNDYLFRLGQLSSSFAISESGEIIKEDIKGGVPDFIKKKHEQLNKLEKTLVDIENEGTTTMLQQQKLANQIALIQTQIELKKLQVENYRNEGIYIYFLINKKAINDQMYMELEEY